MMAARLLHLLILFKDHQLALLELLFEGVNDGSVLLGHLLALLELLQLRFEGVDDGSVLLGHLLNVSVEGVNDGKIL